MGQKERLFIALHGLIFKSSGCQSYYDFLACLTKCPEGSALLFVDLLGFFLVNFQSLPIRNRAYLKCCKSVHGGVENEGNQVAPTSKIFNYTLMRWWSSLAFATFNQNFIVHIHLQLSNNYLVLGICKHSQ